MKNNKSYFFKLFLITFIFAFSVSIFAETELDKNSIDKKVTEYNATIGEVEKDLKESDLTDNELKFFRNKLLKTLEELTNQKKECNEEIENKTELLENYGSAFLSKDKEKNRLITDDSSIEKYKKLREEVALSKNYVNSIDKPIEKINLLLNDIAYEGLKNRTKGLFTFNTPFYTTNAWISGYKELAELYLDGNKEFNRVYSLLDIRTTTVLLVILVIALLIIYIYSKICVKLFKFLLSKLDCENATELVRYKDLFFKKPFFIFSRFMLCAMIPIIILDHILEYVCQAYFSIDNEEGWMTLIIFNTICWIWGFLIVASTYFIKKLNLLPDKLAASRTLKFRIYFFIFLTGALCFFNDIDIVNVAITFNPMVYPDGAAILNLIIIILLSIGLLSVIPYINLYIKSSKKRTLFIAKITKVFVIFWAIVSPVLTFIGGSNLSIDVTLNIMETLGILFFYSYMYYTIKKILPLLMNSIASFFDKIAYNDNEKYLEHEHEVHKKQPHSKDLIRYWINFLVLLGIIIWVSLEFLITWGFPPNTLSHILDVMFFEQIHIAGKPAFSIWILFISIVSGLVVFYIFKIIQYVLEKKVFPYTRLDEGTRHAFKTTIGYIGLLSAVIIFVYTLGVNMTALTFIISGLSIGIGFSLQELFKNFFSGFVLLIERPIKIGDILNIDGHPAKVKKIRIRCTILESSEKDIIVIPNSELVNSRVVNETTFPLSRIEIGMDVAYSGNPARVAEILKTVADSHEKVSKTFKPVVEFAKFNDYSITLILKAFVKRLEKDEVTSDLKFMLFNAMKENKIAMAEIPPSNIYIKEVDWNKEN